MYIRKVFGTGRQSEYNLNTLYSLTGYCTLFRDIVKWQAWNDIGLLSESNPVYQRGPEPWHSMNGLRIALKNYGSIIRLLEEHDWFRGSL